MRAIIAAALLAVAPQHDTVFMGDGGRVVGTVVEEGPQGVSIQLLDGTVRRYPSRDVLRVEYADGTVSSSRAPAQQPAATAPAQQPPATAPAQQSAVAPPAAAPQQGAPPATVVIQVPTYAPPPAAVPQQYAPPAPPPQGPPAQQCSPAPCTPQQSAPAPQPAPSPQYPPQQYPPQQQPPQQYGPPPYPPPPRYRQYPPQYPPYGRPPQPAYPAPRRGMAPISAVYAVLGVGGLGMSGDVEEGVATSRLFEPQVGFWLETGLRLAPEVSLGAYLGLGLGDPAEEVRTLCTSLGETCTAHTGRIGILLRRTFDPTGRTAPWIAAGTGFEWGGVTTDGSSSDGFTYSGWEALRLMAGVDLRSSPVLGVGLYGAVAWGRYTRYEDAAGTVDLGRQPFHTTAELGLRFTLFP